MTNQELNNLSINELISLNKRIIEMVKLKKQVEGRMNLDNLSVGMTVKYKGSNDKLKKSTFIIKKISKVNAQCQDTVTNVIWNINLANIEKAENIFEKEPDVNYSNESENMIFCKKVSDGRGFWIERYNNEQKQFFLSIGFVEDRNALMFKSKHKDFLNMWSIEEEQKIHTAIKNHFGFTQIKTKLLTYADMV